MSYVYEKNCRLDPSKLHKLWSVPSIKQYFGKCVPYMCRLGIYTQKSKKCVLSFCFVNKKRKQWCISRNMLSVAPLLLSIQRV